MTYRCSLPGSKVHVIIERHYKQTELNSSPKQVMYFILNTFQTLNPLTDGLPPFRGNEPLLISPRFAFFYFVTHTLLPS